MSKNHYYEVLDFVNRTVWYGTAKSADEARRKFFKEEGLDRYKATGQYWVRRADASENPSHRYRKTTKRKNPSDAQVIKAFTEQRAAASSKLQTDGRRLDGLWMGGGGIAAWEGDKIVFYDLGSKAADAVRRQVVRAIPRNWIHANSVWVLPMSTLRKEGYGSAMGRKRNPPSSGLGGTYIVTHANPFLGFLRKPKPKFVQGDAVSLGAGRPAGVVLDKKWNDGAWHYFVAWPKSYSNKDTLEHEGDLTRARRNPDLSGPLMITHDGPDIHITHKANPSRAPFGWAKVEGGVVVKTSRSARKPGNQHQRNPRG